MAGRHRRSLTVIVLGLLPALWTAWLLWIAPVDGLTADRTALAARDFTALWGAGRAAADHALAVLADPAAFTAYLRLHFGAGIPHQIWPYPPPILLLARPMAELPLLDGFIAYSLLSIAALWLATAAGGLSAVTRAAILLSPAVLTNALAGQNGALIAALLCGGLFLVDRRPLLAGILLGASAIKPQFAVLLPVCLIAGAHWRVAVSGCMTAIALASMSAYIFGIAPWIDFLVSGRSSASAYIGAPWQSEPAQLIFCSVFMAIRSLGGGIATAYLCQTLVSLGCACCAWRLWRGPRLDATARAAATLPLILLAAPWVHTYDMPALAVAIALLAPRAATGRRAWLALAWLWPGLPPMIALPPIVSVLSLGSVAWFAGWSSWRGWLASPHARAAPQTP